MAGARRPAATSILRAALPRIGDRVRVTCGRRRRRSVLLQQSDLCRGSSPRECVASFRAVLDMAMLAHHAPATPTSRCRPDDRSGDGALRGPTPARRARRTAGPLVFVTDELPLPGAAGHLALNHAIISFLAARGHDIVVLLVTPRLSWPAERFAPALDPARVRVEGAGLVSGRGWVAAKPAAALRILGRRALGLVPAGLRERLRRRARAGAYGTVDAVLGRSVEPAEAAWAAGRIAALGAGAVLVDTIFRAPVLREAALRGLPSVLVTHDVFHRRHAGLAARGLRLYPPTLPAEAEAAMLRLADVIVAIQPEEEALLRALVPDRRVICAPMSAQPKPRPPGVAREPGLFAFVGSDAVHNLDGLRWLLEAVWPRLRAILPGARLEICGTAGPALPSPLPPGVVVRGVVADLGSVLHRASVAVAPLLAGSGLKVKILDYLAHGLSVVATPVAAEGLEPAPDRPVVLAGEAEAFARAAAALAADAEGSGRRERQALEYCRLYAPSRVFASLAEALEGGADRADGPSLPLAAAAVADA